MWHTGILVYSFVGLPTSSAALVIYLDMLVNWHLCWAFFVLSWLISTKILNLALLLSSHELMKPTLFQLMHWADLRLTVHCTFILWWERSYLLKCAFKATIIWWELSSICDSLMYCGISSWNNVDAMSWLSLFTARHLLSTGSIVK